MDFTESEKYLSLISFQSEYREDIHKQIKKNINYNDESRGYPYSFNKDASFFDCRLHPREHLDREFQILYSQSVFDRLLRKQLEKSQALNWCPDLLKLEPVAVPKDGNCLLHAVSFAIWSVFDEHFTLRELLLLAMTHNRNDSYKRRWWRQKLLDLKSLKDESKIISQQWEEVVRSISALSKSSISKAAPHELLESVHIYVLSNILRRPIIVVTDTVPSNGSDFEDDSHIAGMYLPLEWPPIKCCKTPIILGFSKGHFCPLLSEAKNKKEPFFPLVTADFCSLPIRFLSQQEEHKASELVQCYFIVKEANIPFIMHGRVPVPCAVLNYKDLPVEMNTVIEHFKLCEHQKMCQQPVPGAQHGGRDEAKLLHQLHMDSQTKVAPMRSFSQSYQMSLKNQEIKVIAQAGKNMSEKKAPEDVCSGVQRCVIKGCQRVGNALRGNFCDICWNGFAGGEVGIGSMPGSQMQFGEIAMVPGFNQPEIGNAVPTEPSAPPASRLNSLEGPISMLDERCHNKCGYRCSQETYPYCHECFTFTGVNQQGPQGSTAISDLNDINNPAGNLMLFSPPPPPNVQSPFLGNTLTIHTQGEKGNNNHHKLIKMSTSETKKTLLENKMGSVNDQALTEQMIPGAVKAATRPAESQGHHEALQLNELALSDRKQSPDEDREADIIYISAEAINCVSPFCEEKVNLPNKLCDKCQAVLLKAQKQHKSEAIVSTFLGNGTDTTRRNEALHRQKLSEMQTGHKDKPTIQAAQDQEAKQKTEMKFRQRGKPCITSGCLNYGDPVNADMCSSCYMKLALREYEKLKRDSKVRARAQWGVPVANVAERKADAGSTLPTDQSLIFCFAPSSSSHSAQTKKPTKANTVTLPVSAFCTNKTSLNPSSGYRDSMHCSLENFPTVDINAFNQGFAQEYDKFRDQTSAGLKRCKVPACSNYGNPSKGGFCNSCHVKREEKRYEERIALFGENVPDCWSCQQNSI
ncbi:hypothetical protein EGW08_001468 [Elysia chlorotica]|uniref:ubiquitinyl hydrolase 1 n=1 Tax=Elysia chlorotica TaxID=188477 RepID=A0A433UAC7_ELYCH|nr:hypothetical protein EGW08_001468 [Elysia chlorotica]